tara:strand:- start:14956 stop:15174 length:219 start_codon:yes stop_codon:yes gene_type:complete
MIMPVSPVLDLGQNVFEPGQLQLLQNGCIGATQFLQLADLHLQFGLPGFAFALAFLAVAVRAVFHVSISHVL